MPPAVVDNPILNFPFADYDGESFFVRYAYFTGAGEPFEKLKPRFVPTSTRRPGPRYTAP